jgi:hypothetical protein
MSILLENLRPSSPLLVPSGPAPRALKASQPSELPLGYAESACVELVLNHKIKRKNRFKGESVILGVPTPQVKPSRAGVVG